ncbi:MAG: hypothetical protein IKX02_00395 [Spirochaetales bacterium]|nr:hypothetical protein [Spirochaetales bacterium]
MTIRDIKDIIDSLDEDQLDNPVYLLMQPSWPFDYSVGEAAYLDEGTWDIGEEAAEEYGEPRQEDVRPGLYLTEGRQLCYAGYPELSEFGWR